MKEYVSRPLKKSYDLGKYAPLYRSAIISLIKNARAGDRDLQPTVLDFGAVRFGIARHFGFCKGVENAIEMAYEALLRNQNKRVFMVSELIHNPYVNEDLLARGLRFIKTSKGKQLIDWDEIQPDDVVVIPAFGATVQDKQILTAKGIEVKQWDAMCRFVEHVWFRSEELGKKGYSIIIHGKFNHEETQATFSYSQQFAPTVVVKDMAEAKLLGEFILGEGAKTAFYDTFGKVCSQGFDFDKALEKVAVVNQTTMLASETAEIANYFREIMIQKYGNENPENHVANTKDTLCYATKNNQTATIELLREEADLAIVIGGRNSSNTTHLVELCQEKLPTYFIQSEQDILSATELLHYDFEQKTEHLITHYLPTKATPNILLTSGASCPDTLVEKVLTKLLSFFDGTRTIEEVVKDFSGE
ncbi:MAG: 4-hydroxy-3-methylbut-2-enyl diphosphate reductase [Bacteroidia bacterium]